MDKKTTRAMSWQKYHFVKIVATIKTTAYHQVIIIKLNMTWVSQNKYNRVVISSKRQRKYKIWILLADLPTQFQFLGQFKEPGPDPNLEGILRK